MSFFRFITSATLSLALSILSIAASSAQTTAAPDSPARTDLPLRTYGRLGVSWTPGNGLFVSVDEVPVIRKSSLYLVKQGWTATLLDQRNVKPVVSGWTERPGAPPSATVTLENENARCVYTIQLGMQGQKELLEVTLHYKLKNDIPAEIEYATGYLNGPVLQGATAVGAAADIPITLREIPVAPPAPSRSQEQNRVCPPFTRLDLGTRLGQLSLAYTGTAPLPVLFDARSESQTWAKEFPVFWLGIGSPAQTVRFTDGEKTARFRLTVGARPAPLSDTPPIVAENLTRSAIRPDAYIPAYPATPVIIPTPKRVVFPPDGAPFRINARTRLLLLDTTEGTRRAAAVLLAALKERFGIVPGISRAGERVSDADNVVLLGVVGRSAMLSRLATSAPPNAEGYGLTVTDKQVQIVGRDGAGILWGAQTAVQLLGADATGPLLRLARVWDWPSLKIRGVHLFHGHNALPFHQKLIDRVLSRFKMNTLVIQAEQVRWNHDPDVAPPWAGTRDAITREIDFAREHGMTVYPLIQSYGHMEWLFSKGKNQEFAEDPETPYAVNFTNPAALRYLEGFNTEADALFKAPAFHIGLDEVTMRGRFPLRSQPRTFADLFVSGATHWQQFFKKRGKSVWMWADMALHPSEVAPSFGTAPSAAEAARVRAGLPKEIVMVDWQYGAHNRFPSLRKLKDAGFKKLIAATWFNPENIQNFSRAAADIGALGALQTTWCGYESQAGVLETVERRQFIAMVLAAEYFWNGGTGPTPDRLPYDPSDVFARQWRDPHPSDYRLRAGWTLRIAPVGNRPVTDLFGLGGINSPRGLVPGETRARGGTIFEMPEKALLLHGKLSPPGTYPEQVFLRLQTPPETAARSVRLLLTTTHRTARNMPVGTATAVCSDGSEVDVPLIYGKNIAAWDEPGGIADAPTVWEGETAQEQRVTLRRLDISVSGDKSIVALRLKSLGTEAAPLIVAVTALAE